MRRIIIHLFVALLTFAIGTAASALFYSAAPSTVTTTKREVVLEKSTMPLPESETLSSLCGCHQGDDVLEPAEDEVAPKTPINGGVLNGRAVSLPAPPYPPIARAAHASGTVAVQIIINERGCIESATAIKGHPLLQRAAVQAAYNACFTPTRLSGQPVKVTGVLTYNFVPEN